MWSSILQHKLLIGLASTILVVSLGIGANIVLNDNTPTVSDETKWTDKTGKVDDSFYTSSMSVAPEPEPEPEPLPDLPPLPEPTIKAEDVFRFEEPVAYQDLAAENINKMRRNSEVATFLNGSDDLGATDTGIWENTQKDWGEQKSVSSYKVDMTRVFTVDRYIACTLYNELDSELPGKVVLVVKRNHFGAQGRKILFPAYTKLVGYYKPLAKVGDTRVGFIIERLITPEGVNINLENAELADAQGRAGMTGELDKRFLEKYGLALGIAAIDTLVKYQIATKNQNMASVVQNFGSSSANLSRTVLEENINIKPKLRIPAGTIVNVSPLKDVWMKEPKNGTMQFEEIKG